MRLTNAIESTVLFIPNTTTALEASFSVITNLTAVSITTGTLINICNTTMQVYNTCEYICSLCRATPRSLTPRTNNHTHRLTLERGLITFHACASQTYTQRVQSSRINGCACHGCAWIDLHHARLMSVIDLHRGQQRGAYNNTYLGYQLISVEI